MVIVQQVYKAASFFPDDKRYGLRSQITGGAVSIQTDITEESAKNSQKEYRHLVAISLGSAFGLETQSLIIQQQEWHPIDKVETLLALTIEEQKMLVTFMNRL